MKSENYKGVDFADPKHPRFKNIKKRWVAQLQYRGVRWRCHYLTEREAAIGYDMRLIRYGLEPINILKKVV